MCRSPFSIRARQILVLRSLRRIMQKTSLLDVNGAAKVGLDPRTFSFYITPLESLRGIHQSREISHPIATVANF